MKVKSFIMSSFFFLWVTSTMIAQISEMGHIKGTVSDSLTGGVMPFASVTFQQNGKDIVGVQTTKNGIFDIKKLPYGDYDLNVQYLGYRLYKKKISLNFPELTLPIVQMILNQINLAEVKVIGKRPFLEQSIDKMILNVSESIIGAGGFATDLLRRVPGMSVGNDGRLMFRGRAGTQVMIDGKLLNLSGEEIGKLLESMPTGAIDKIEIITNPSAKYDAEGRGAGVVNIKTIKGKAWGTNGNINTSIGSGEKYRYTTGIDLNYRVEKLNLFGSYNHVDTQQKIVIDTRSIRNGTIFNESYVLNTHRYNNSLRLGIDYQLNKKSTLGLLLTGFSNQAPANRKVTIDFVNSAKGTFDSTLNSFMTKDVQWNNGTINLNFIKKIDSTGKLIKVDLDYLNNDYKGTESFKIERLYPNVNESLYSYFRNNLPLKIEIISANIDYSNPISNEKELSMGIKSKITGLLNDTRFETPVNDTWQTDLLRTNFFKFQENVNALYINYKTIFSGVNLIMGLRAEHTSIVGNSVTKHEVFTQSYLQLFPNITLQKRYAKEHETKISYQKSIGRPSYNQFNPFLAYSDNYNLSKGNPTLNPAIYHNVDFTHSYKDELFLGVGVNINDGGISYLPRQTGQVLAYVYENFGLGEDYYFYADYISSPVKWWQTNNSLGIYYQLMKGSYDNSTYQYQTPFYAFYSINTFTLGKGCNAELAGYYKSDGLSGIYEAKRFWYFDTGLSKSILSGKGNLKISMTDIFNSLRSGWDVHFSNLDLSARRKDETRFIKLNFAYRFGNANVKRSRNRQTGIGEDNQRLGSQN